MGQRRWRDEDPGKAGKEGGYGHLRPTPITRTAREEATREPEKMKYVVPKWAERQQRT